MVVEELKNFNSSIIKKEKEKKRKENELSFIKKKKKLDQQIFSLSW